MARAKALFAPARSNNYFARSFFTSGKTFGWTIPNNAKAIQDGLLPLARPSDEEILEGSIFHVVSPLLSPRSRAALRDSIFFGGIGTRNLDRYYPFKFCAKCAREDQLNKISQHWRVVPNHPAVLCCDRHGVYLTPTLTIPGVNALYDPSVWIDPTVPIPELATSVEVRIAADVRWIHEQHSSITLKSGDVVRTLREAILDSHGYRRRGSLLGREMAEELLARFRDILQRVDPTLIDCIEKRTVWNRMSLQRCLLLTQFADISVKDLFDRAQSGQVKATPAARIDRSRKEIQDFIASNPHATRMEVQAARPVASRELKRLAPAVYGSLMPASLSRVSRRRVDWESRDRQLSVALKERLVEAGVSFSTVAAVLKLVAYSPGTFSRNRRRLPLTSAVVRSAIVRLKPSVRGGRLPLDHRIASAAARVEAIRKVDPDVSVSALRKQDLGLYQTLNRHAPELLPAQKRTDWAVRDDLLHSRISELALQLPQESRTSKGKILLAAGESEQLLKYARGRLPRVESLVENLIIRGPSAQQIEAAKRALRSIVDEHPDLSRQQVMDLDPLSAGRLQRAAPEFFEKIMPARRVGGRTCDWAKLDIELVQLVRRASGAIPVRERCTPTRILKACGVSPFRLLTSKGRLPETEATLASLIVPFDLAAQKRQLLVELVRSHPNEGREALRLRDRTTVEYVMREDPSYYEAVMPRPKNRRDPAISTEMSA